MANRRATNGGISRMNGRIFTTNGSPRGTIWNLRGKTLPLFINKRNPYILNTASVSLYAIAQSVRNYPPVRHEVVGHKGLRDLFGKEEFDGIMERLYGQLPENARKEVNDAAEAKYASNAA